MALDNCFDLLCEVAPEVAPHQAWLTQARDAALALFDKDEGDQAA